MSDQKTTTVTINGMRIALEPGSKPPSIHGGPVLLNGVCYNADGTRGPPHIGYGRIAPVSINAEDAAKNLADALEREGSAQKNDQVRWHLMEIGKFIAGMKDEK